MLLYALLVERLVALNALVFLLTASEESEVLTCYPNQNLLKRYLEVLRRLLFGDPQAVAYAFADPLLSVICITATPSANPAERQVEATLLSHLGFESSMACLTRGAQILGERRRPFAIRGSGRALRPNHARIQNARLQRAVGMRAAGDRESADLAALRRTGRAMRGKVG